MGTAAATIGDSVIGVCMHTYMSTSPSPAGPVPTPVPTPGLPFNGKITGPGNQTVLIMGKPASVMGDAVANTPIHPPTGGASIVGPIDPTATNTATITVCTATVLVGGKQLAKTGDKTGPECGLIPGGGPATVTGTAATVLVG